MPRENSKGSAEAMIWKSLLILFGFFYRQLGNQFRMDDKPLFGLKTMVLQAAGMIPVMMRQHDKICVVKIKSQLFGIVSVDTGMAGIE